jgi:hypothetical protein
MSFYPNGCSQPLVLLMSLLLLLFKLEYLCLLKVMQRVWNTQGEPGFLTLSAFWYSLRAQFGNGICFLPHVEIWEGTYSAGSTNESQPQSLESLSQSYYILPAAILGSLSCKPSNFRRSVKKLLSEAKWRNGGNNKKGREVMWSELQWGKAR